MSLTLVSFWTWVWIFSSFSPNQFFKNHASNLTSLISFQNPSLNTKVELKELQHLHKLKRTHPKLWWTLYQNILLSLPYLFSCDSAQFLQERIPHREQREASVLYYFLSNFFRWESERGGKWMGVLKAQCQGVFGGIFTFEGKSLATMGHQTDMPHKTPDDVLRKTLLFSSLFQHEVSGGGISNLHCEQQWDSQSRMDGGPWPSLLTCGWSTCLPGVGMARNRRVLFLVVWKSSHPVVFYSFFLITYPAWGNVPAILQLLRRWLSQSSLVNKGLGHHSWRPGPPWKSYSAQKYLEGQNFLKAVAQLHLSSV